MVPTLPPRLREIDSLSYMIRRELIDRIEGKGWTHEHGHDFVFIAKIAAVGRAHFIHKVLGKHRRFRTPKQVLARAVRRLLEKVGLVRE